MAQSTVAGAAQRDRWLLAAGLVPLLGLGVWAFRPAFEGFSFLVAGMGGLLAGLGLGALAAARRWPWYFTALGSLAAYLLLAAPVALRSDAIFGVLPSVATIAEAGRGLGTAWKDLLTAEVPVLGLESPLLVPLMCGLAAGVVTVLLALRPARPAWALAPAVVLAVTAMSFGTYLVALPAIVAVTFALGAAVWLAVARRAMRRLDSSRDQARPSTPWTTIAYAAAMLGVAGVLGTLAGTAAQGGSRDVLRNHVSPPFDVHDYASPLQAYRGLVADAEAPVLLTVAGLPSGARVRLATVDMYDGTVYGVGATGEAGSGVFQRLGGSALRPAGGDQVTVQIGSLTGVWLPDVGATEAIVFDDGARRTVYLNRASGTAVLPEGLTDGLSYTVYVSDAQAVQPGELGDAPYENLLVPSAQGVPESVAQAAALASAGATSDADRMIRMAEWLQLYGYFSHGLEGEATSASGHGALRIDTLLTAETMVGDDEQYAVTLALMARSLGIPARVVMGFHAGADPVTAVTSEQLHAWVEVPFDGYGWVAFDATPDADKPIPEEQQPPERIPEPQVLQPPPPAEEPTELPPADAVEDEELASDSPLVAALLAIGLYVAVGGGILLVLLAPFIAILVAKARRRRRRRAQARTADSVAGAWDEITDAAADAGVELTVGATRVEHGAVLDEALGAEGAVALARRADDGVFGAALWEVEATERFWDDTEEYVRRAYADQGRFKGLRARLSLRSLARRHRRSRMTGGGS